MSELVNCLTLDKNGKVIGTQVRYTRRFVSILCDQCFYVRGVKDERGSITCGMCGQVIR